MNNHKQELQRFCNDQGCSKETFQKALEYLQSVHAKRAGQRTTGNALVPTCAYLASQRLQNNEISKDAAHKKSCLTPAIFEKEYENIRTLLPLDGSSSRQGRKAQGYDQLVRRYRPSVSRTIFHHWLQEVENQLASSPKTFDWESVAAKCAIFFWAYEAIEDKSLNKHHFADENQIDRGNFTRIFSYLDSLCKEIKDEILESTTSLPLASLSSPTLVTTTPRTSPRKSPLKRPLRAVLSRDSPKKPKMTEPELATESEYTTFSEPPASTALSEDVEMVPPPPKTPSKRMGPFGEYDTSSPSSRQISELRARASGHVSPTRRLRKTLKPPSTSKLTTSEQPVTPSRRKSTRIKATSSQSPSKATRSPPKTRSEDLMVVDSVIDAPSSDDDEVGIDSPISRRFRPVFRDRKLWCSGDPQLRIDWERAKKVSQKRVEVYGHPFQEFRS